MTLVVITTIDDTMSKTAHPAREGKRPISSPEEAALLDLVRTADILSRGIIPVLKLGDLSPTQYNVLRILRGAREGLPCGEIAGRMITRDPDITRLLDRLERRRLIARARDDKDRRTVLTHITPAGLRLLATLDGPVQRAHRRQLAHLGPRRLRKLAELLRAAREGALA
ncbi:MAG TPA: MarR family transcriptional regulator [Candidatus Acidoferrales bacterium]|nr:MarR family transcriptional regulator [Candidatus Acidoferrales bacterium]